MWAQFPQPGHSGETDVLEPARGNRTVGPTVEKSDLRVEVLSHLCVLEIGVSADACIADTRVVRGLATGSAGGFGPGHKTFEISVRTDSHLPVESPGPVPVFRVGPGTGCVTADHDASQIGAVGQLAAEAGDREVVFRRDAPDVVGLHIQEAEIEGSHLAAQAGASQDRNGSAGILIDPDATAEEQVDRRSCPPQSSPRSRERKDVSPESGR